jgi:hypothetical protein
MNSPDQQRVANSFVTSSANLGLKPEASAPVKAFDQEGESPFQANVTSLNNKSNCVAVRQGGEQLELNDQSVTK